MRLTAVLWKESPSAYDGRDSVVPAGRVEPTRLSTEAAVSGFTPKSLMGLLVILQPVSIEDIVELLKNDSYK